MYKREVKPAPEKIIQHNRPVFGTFNTLPKSLDIHGIKAPFLSIPIPAAFTKLRIRARLIYVFNVGEYLGSIDIFDNKILNLAEVCLWNPKTNTKHVYRIFLGLRLALIPKNLEKAVCVSTAKTRYIRIGYNHSQDRISVKFKVKGCSVRPSVELAIAGKFSNPLSAECFSVKPAPTMRRCSATWYAFTPISGHMKLTSKYSGLLESMPDLKGTGFLFSNRTYYKFITSGENITACGVVNEKTIGFRLSTTSLDAVNQDAYNDNVIFIDGKLTTLPPVDITHSFGLLKNWIIQDVESMVDLTFTPKNNLSRHINLIGVNSTYNTIFGTIEGTFLDSEGNKIHLKDFPGIVKSSKLRL